MLLIFVMPMPRFKAKYIIAYCSILKGILDPQENEAKAWHMVYVSCMVALEPRSVVAHHIKDLGLGF